MPCGRVAHLNLHPVMHPGDMQPAAGGAGGCCSAVQREHLIPAAQPSHDRPGRPYQSLQKDQCQLVLSCNLLQHPHVVWLCWQVLNTLAVGHNKLGDLCYTRGNLHEARECYRAALDTRRMAFAKGVLKINALCASAISKMDSPLRSGDLIQCMADRRNCCPGDEEDGIGGGPEVALGLVTSLLKTSDIEEVRLLLRPTACLACTRRSAFSSGIRSMQALGNQAAAAAGLEEAMSALEAASSKITPGFAEAAKQARLQQFLEAKMGCHADESA